jgi:hypothetical protein
MVESSTQTSWCCTGAASMSSQKKARGLPGMMIILLLFLQKLKWKVFPSQARRVPIQTGIQRKLNFVSVRTIKGSSS